MEARHLLHPLIPTTTTTVGIPITTITFVDGNDADNIKTISSDSSIFFRLISVMFIGLLSIWANYEASKGFEITITNDAADSPAGQRFTLFYLSNDKATRIVLHTSKFVEKLLYPDNSHPKKQVNHVILRLASQNLTHMVIIDSTKQHEFVLHMSPSIMEETNANHAMLSAVQQGMARLWLHNNAPTSLINGMVEYISSLAGLGGVSGSGTAESPEPDDICWKDKDPIAVAHFLNYCEGHKKGFIKRLNQAMKDRWHDRTVDDALGMPAEHLCASYKSSKNLQTIKSSHHVI